MVTDICVAESSLPTTLLLGSPCLDSDRPESLAIGAVQGVGLERMELLAGELAAIGTRKHLAIEGTLPDDAAGVPTPTSAARTRSGREQLQAVPKGRKPLLQAGDSVVSMVVAFLDKRSAEAGSQLGNPSAAGTETAVQAAQRDLSHPGVLGHPAPSWDDQARRRSPNPACRPRLHMSPTRLHMATDCRAAPSSPARHLSGPTSAIDLGGMPHPTSQPDMRSWLGAAPNVTAPTPTGPPTNPGTLRPSSRGRLGTLEPVPLHTITPSATSGRPKAWRH